MNSRQRGAAWLLGALLAGRLVDRFDLPFERRPGPAPAVPDSAFPVPAPTAAVRADSAAPIPTPRRARAGGDATLAPLHINHATATDLQRLPGVGPVLAGRIVAHRAAHGAFHGLADLGAVRGLGPKTCARLAPLLRFD